MEWYFLFVKNNNYMNLKKWLDPLIKTNKKVTLIFTRELFIHNSKEFFCSKN